MSLFLSYRHGDCPYATDRIHERLVRRYGRGNVFRDVESLPLGVDIRAHLTEEVGCCRVLLVVIGPQWLEATGPAGNRRLDDPEDYVRVEIETALRRGIPVIPVLVQGAAMPRVEQLPLPLQPLAFRSGLAVRGDPD